MECGIKRILLFDKAVNYGPIQVIDDKQQDITNSCSYSWSSDKLCWTNWVDYTNYQSLCAHVEGDFYLRVLLYGGFDKIAFNGTFTNCFTICIDSSNPFTQSFCANDNLFDPYANLDCAMQLYEQTCESIVCTFGIPIYYLRVAPKEDSADYTFKEYTLHDIVDIKQIQMVIEDGTLPSSNPKFTELDFDWENDWPVELGKAQFATAFGDTIVPKQRDLIYVPLLTRMYEVNSAYDERNEGFMWRSTTWKLSLVKYNSKTNVDKGGFEDLIDTWVVNNYEDTFGKKERNEQEREVGARPVEAPKFSATNLCDIFMEDAIRKQYTKADAAIINKQYNHHSTVVARNYYKFNNSNAAVTYQKGYCGANGTLMFILETQGYLEGSLSKEIIQMGPICVDIDYRRDTKDFNLKFNDLNCVIQPFTTYMVVCRWSKDLSVNELNVYEYTHEQDIPIYKLKPELYYFDYDNPLVEISSMYNQDYACTTPQDCQIHAYPVYLTNIKLYNTYLSKEDSIKESLKYTTQNENNIINDVARPISSGRGFDVK